jgi:hypothetical protein
MGQDGHGVGVGMGDTHIRHRVDLCAHESAVDARQSPCVCVWVWRERE